MVKRSLAALVLSLIWSAEAAEKLAGGPFVVNVSPRKATVVWVVQTSEAKLGKAPDQLTTVSPTLKTERVTFTGLSAGTTYYYDVLSGEEGKGRFKTPPAGPASFRFLVLGDTRSRHDVHAKVIQAAAKCEPDFVLNTGDLVSDGENTPLWPIFFSVERELLKKAVIFPTPGNHERNSRHYYEFFDLKEPYYSFDWGAVHVTVLNSDIGNVASSQAAKEQFWNEQLRWLEEDLGRAQKAGLRIAMMHHPPFSAVKKRQGPPNILERVLVPLFEKYRVQVVFCGHDHNYQRHLKNGIRYIVTGGGGAPLYPVDGPIPGLTQKAESIEHFVQVDVDGSKARVQALALDGRVIDSFELNP